MIAWWPNRICRKPIMPVGPARVPGTSLEDGFVNRPAKPER